MLMEKFYFDELDIDDTFFDRDEEEWEDELLDIIRLELQYREEDFDGLEIDEVNRDEGYVWVTLY